MDDRLTELEAEVAEFRRLTAEDPENLYPGLGFALSDLGSHLRDLDRYDEALAAAREAAEVFELAAAHEDEFHMPWAMALNNLAARLQDCGQVADALEASRRALDVAADLPPDQPETATIMAAARFNMASQLFLLGAGEEGVAVLLEVARSTRRLREAGRADAAQLQCSILQDFGDRARSREGWAEWIGFRRALSLALGDPANGRALVVQALGEAATSVSDPERIALWAQQAGELLADPEVAQRVPPDFAATLSSRRAMALDELDRCDDAIQAWEAAVAAWRAVEGGAARHAAAQGCLGAALLEADRTEAAIAALHEAASLWRARPSLDPSGDAVMFGDVLRHLGRTLADTGRFAEALAVAEEGMKLVLSSVVEAGVGDQSALAAFEQLRACCLDALRDKP